MPSSNPTIAWLAGLVCTIAMSLSSFTLVWQFNTNAQIAVMADNLEDIQADVQKDMDQDEAIANNKADLRHNNRLNWIRDAWARDQITVLRSELQMPYEAWPEFPPPEDN